jgi:short-chain fatty acids transporter
MFARIGLRLSGFLERFIPDPFVIAIGLTWLTAALAYAFGDFPGLEEGGSRALTLLDAWRDDSGGLWKLLGFGMQMCLVLVTGHALASAPQIRKAVFGLASLPGSTATAAAGVALFACLAGLLNWGLGLILGAFMARDVGRSLHQRGIPVHYPLLVASGYCGLLVWHGGLSGSAPLSMTTEDGFRKVLPAELIGDLQPLTLSSTVFSPLNLFVSGGLLVLVPVIVYWLAPRRPEDHCPPPAAILADQSTPEGSGPPPLGLASSRMVSLLLALPLVLALIRYGVTTGIDRVGLNQITMAMLVLGLVSHQSPGAYARAISEGAGACGGIILQFPLYAGIMAMMVVSGLAQQLAMGLVTLGDEATVGLMSFIAAALTNLFVPSGGGQWAIQGPVALQAGLELGVSAEKMVMSVAYGDQLTNMLQPFWALPLLSITGIEAREIVGYTFILMSVAAVWMAAGLVLV